MAATQPKESGDYKIKIALNHQATGFYWGLANAKNVIAAARRVDHDIDGARGQIYRECDRADKDATYHGFDALAINDRVIDADGQDEGIISLVVEQKYLGSVCRLIVED